ncbi:MAG: hypothetical protein K8R53_16165 [Bacteroidales bacterium]|nr:hypothetical protein [Bacteroidales bacterium]
MSSKILREQCRIGQQGYLLPKNAMEKFSLSAKAYDRILKVSRKIFVSINKFFILNHLPDVVIQQMYNLFSFQTIHLPNRI